MSLSASHFVPTVRFWKSNLASKPKFPSAHESSQDPYLAYSSRCVTLTDGSYHAILCLSYAFPFIRDISSLRWSVSCQIWWEKRQAVLFLLCLTWRKHNLVSAFTLPKLCMHLAHWVCLHQLTTWTILDSLLHTHAHAYTNTHTALKYTTKHQISDCEHSVLWDIHCYLRVQKLQIADLEIVLLCFASGEIRHSQKGDWALAVSKALTLWKFSPMTSTLPWFCSLFFFLSVLEVSFFSYLHLSVRDPANQFPPRSSPNSCCLSLLWTTDTCWASSVVIIILSSGFLCTGHINLELRAGSYLPFSESRFLAQMTSHSCSITLYRMNGMSDSA